MVTKVPRVVIKPRMANKKEVATYSGIGRRKAGDNYQPGDSSSFKILISVRKRKKKKPQASRSQPLEALRGRLKVFCHQLSFESFCLEIFRSTLRVCFS